MDFFYFFFMTYWSIQSWISMVERNTFILFLITEQMFSDFLMHCDVGCDSVIYTLYINFSNDEGCYFFVLFVHRLTYHMFWSLLCWDHILCILVSAFWTILKSLDKSHIIMLNNVGDVLLSSFCYYFIRQMACSLWLV